MHDPKTVQRQNTCWRVFGRERERERERERQRQRERERERANLA